MQIKFFYVILRRLLSDMRKYSENTTTYNIMLCNAVGLQWTLFCMTASSEALINVNEGGGVNLTFPLSAGENHSFLISIIKIFFTSPLAVMLCGEVFFLCGSKARVSILRVGSPRSKTANGSPRSEITLFT